MSSGAMNPLAVGVFAASSVVGICGLVLGGAQSYASRAFFSGNVPESASRFAKENPWKAGVRALICAIGSFLAAASLLFIASSLYKDGCSRINLSQLKIPLLLTGAGFVPNALLFASD